MRRLLYLLLFVMLVQVTAVSCQPAKKTKRGKVTRGKPIPCPVKDC